MCCRFRGNARNAWLLTAAAAVVTACTFGARAFADDVAEHEEGRIVDMDADGSTARLDLRHRQDLIAGDEAPAAPAYWLGIQGQPVQSEVLRTHLQLAEGVGIVIEDVVPGSPAEKAGLRRHDVLLNVGGEQISDMAVLQKAVADSHGKALELKVIRLAKEETISVTPEAPPADLAAKMLALNTMTLDGGDPMGQIQAMMKQLQQNGVGGGVRVFGPGMVGGMRPNTLQLRTMQLPDNVKVSIAHAGGSPAVVTVEKDGQTWTIRGDDKEALAKLPDDVRPYVEQMLQGGQNVGAAGVLGGLDLKFDGRDLEALRETAKSMIGDDADDEGRLEDMEKRLEWLEKRFQENSGQEGDESSEPSA
jgi:membrane-associated protease RseP (regulator of RpoE activity)